MSEISEKWELIKDTVRNEYELSDISFDTWIKPLRFYDVCDNTVVIMIPSEASHALNYINTSFEWQMPI